MINRLRLWTFAIKLLFQFPLDIDIVYVFKKENERKQNFIQILLKICIVIVTSNV